MKKIPLTTKTIATKGILTDPGRVEGLLKHIKSLPQSVLRKIVFCPRWPPRWPQIPINDYYYVTIQSNLMNLVSIPRFQGTKNT